MQFYEEPGYWTQEKVIEAAEALYPAYQFYKQQHPDDEQVIWNFLATTSYTSRQQDDIRIRLAHKSCAPAERLALFRYEGQPAEVPVGTFGIDTYMGHRRVFVCVYAHHMAEGGYDMEDEYHPSGWMIGWVVPTEAERATPAFKEMQLNLDLQLRQEQDRVRYAQQHPYDG